MSRGAKGAGRRLVSGLLLLAVAVPAASFAQGGGHYSLEAGSGGQAQVGGWLPLPLQAVPQPTSGTATVFPPRGIPPAAGASVMQRVAADGFDLTVAPGVFRRVPANALVQGVAQQHPQAFQVRTNLSFSAPGSFATGASHTMNTRVFAAGGRTLGVTTGTMASATMAGPSTTTFVGEPPSSSFARYFHTGRRFGGTAQTKVVALSDARVWANGQGISPPCRHPRFGGTLNAHNLSCSSVLLLLDPGSMGAAGGPIGTTHSTTPPPAMSPGVVQVSIPNSQGTIAQSHPVAVSGGLTQSTVSVGFPWTTGALELEQTTAQGGPQKVRITGHDGRNRFGTGTLSLVAGALGNRRLMGPDANRSWARYVLPEPAATLAAAAALATLALCHGLVRRRRDD